MIFYYVVYFIFMYFLSLIYRKYVYTFLYPYIFNETFSFWHLLCKRDTPINLLFSLSIFHVLHRSFSLYSLDWASLMVCYPSHVFLIIFPKLFCTLSPFFSLPFSFLICTSFVYDTNQIEKQKGGAFHFHFLHH